MDISMEFLFDSSSSIGGANQNQLLDTRDLLDPVSDQSDNLTNIHIHIPPTSLLNSVGGS